MDLNNKIAIATGASSGIGLEITKALVREGAKVIMVAKNKNQLDYGVLAAVAATISFSNRRSMKYGTTRFLTNLDSAGIALQPA